MFWSKNIFFPKNIGYEKCTVEQNELGSKLFWALKRFGLTDFWSGKFLLLEFV